MSPLLTGRHPDARRSGRARLWLVALVVCLPCLALVGLGLMRSTIHGRPASAVIAQEARAIGKAAAESIRETTTYQIVREHQGLAVTQEWSVTAEYPKSPKLVAAARTTAAVGAVVLLLYLVYVLVDGATRGRFRGVAFTLAAAAFIGSCVVVVKLS